MDARTAIGSVVALNSKYVKPATEAFRALFQKIDECSDVEIVELMRPERDGGSMLDAVESLRDAAAQQAEALAAVSRQLRYRDAQAKIRMRASRRGDAN